MMPGVDPEILGEVNGTMMMTTNSEVDPEIVGKASGMTTMMILIPEADPELLGEASGVTMMVSGADPKLSVTGIGQEWKT